MSDDKKVVDIYDANGKKEIDAEAVEDDSGVEIIPDDTPKKRAGEAKRRVSRAILRRAEKNPGTKGKRLSTPALISIVVVILLIVFVAADVNAGGVMATVGGQVSSLFSRNSAAEFSVNTDSDNVYDFRAFDKGYMILTDSGVAYINSSGKLSARQQLSYSSAAVEKCGDRVLIYDRGNTGYSLQRDMALYAQQSVENSITDAAVSKKDNYAIAVRGEGSKTILYGYDARGEVIYQWNCPGGYITDVALTENGAKAAATVIDSQNAVLSCQLYILDFEYDSPYAVLTYEGETVVGVKFLTSTKLLVITDKKVYLVNKAEQEVIYDYGSSDIYFTAMSDDSLTAIITTDHSSDETFSLTVFSKKGKLLYTEALSGKVRGLASSEKCIAVLFNDKIETYSKRGTMAGTVTDITHFDEITVSGNYIYTLSSDSVKQFPAYGTHDSSRIAEDETQ